MESSRQPLASGLVFAESPRWCDGRLWFSDVHDYKLKTVDLEGDVTVIADVPGRPAGLGFLPDRSLLMATALDRKLWIVDDGLVTEVADLAGIATGTLNDMVVDERGRAYVGDVGFNPAAGEKPEPGRVLLWTRDDGLRVAAEGVTFPNGCAVSGTRYVVAETLAERVSEFTIGADGRLEEPRVLIELDSPPDGLCLDAEGAIWVAQPLRSRYLRITKQGSIEDEISSAWTFAVTCVLGGPDRRTLFLSSAETDLKRLSTGESTGRMDRLRVEVEGDGRP